MVSELKRANESEEKKAVSLKELRPKAKDSQIKVIKPILLKEVAAVVKDVDIKIQTDEDDIEHDRYNKDNLFYPGYVTVITEFTNPDTNEVIESRDSFGGFRAYIDKDSDGNMIEDEVTGLYQIARYLPGTTGKNKGGLRRFIEAVQKDMTEDEEVEYNDWLKFLLEFLPGQNVYIKSEIQTVDGKNQAKQCIVGLKR